MSVGEKRFVDIAIRAPAAKECKPRCYESEQVEHHAIEGMVDEALAVAANLGDPFDSSQDAEPFELDEGLCRWAIKRSSSGESAAPTILRK